MSAPIALQVESETRLESALLSALRKAFLGPEGVSVGAAAMLAGMIPTDAECAQIRDAGVLGGVALSWVIGLGGQTTWYAKGIHDQVPRKVGGLSDVLDLLESLAVDPLRQAPAALAVGRRLRSREIKQRGKTRHRQPVRRA